jgi:hypothetical protein
MEDRPGFGVVWEEKLIDERGNAEDQLKIEPYPIMPALMNWQPERLGARSHQRINYAGRCGFARRAAPGRFLRAGRGSPAETTGMHARGFRFLGLAGWFAVHD